MKAKVLVFVTITLFLFSSFDIILGNGGLKISGRVFNDKNCNGQRNFGDTGISGVTLTLTPGPIVTTTAANGTYSFTGLSAGTYVITETDPAGYCSITPNAKTVKLVQKDIVNVNFADSKVTVSPPGSSCCAPPPS